MEDQWTVIGLGVAAMAWSIRNLIDVILRLLGRNNGGSVGNSLRQVINQLASVISLQTDSLRKIEDMHRWRLEEKERAQCKAHVSQLDNVGKAIGSLTIAIESQERITADLIREVRGETKGP